MLGTTEAILRQMVDEVISIRTKWIEHMPQLEQVAEPGAEGSPAETEADQGENAARGPMVRTSSRLDPPSTPEFHELARRYSVFGWRTEDEVGRARSRSTFRSTRKKSDGLRSR